MKLLSRVGHILIAPPGQPRKVSRQPHSHSPVCQVPPRSSEAHWSWVHPRWHLPSAVHDCGGSCLNLQDTVLNGSHWSTFAWHCDWQSQSAYGRPGDGQTLIYRWDEVGWVWLIDSLSPSRWGISKPSLHSGTATRRPSVSVSVCYCAHGAVCIHSCDFQRGQPGFRQIACCSWVWWQRARPVR